MRKPAQHDEELAIQLNKMKQNTAVQMNDQNFSGMNPYQ